MMREVIARAICSASQGEWRSGRYNMGGSILDQDDLNNHWRHKAQAALDAISEAGFVIVPKEPTEAMKEVGGDNVFAAAADDFGEDAAKIYRAMIEASQESE